MLRHRTQRGSGRPRRANDARYTRSPSRPCFRAARRRPSRPAAFARCERRPGQSPGDGQVPCSTCLPGACFRLRSLGRGSRRTRVPRLMSASDLRRIFDAAVAAVEPRAAVLRALAIEGGSLCVEDFSGDLAAVERVVVVGAGKAGSGHGGRRRGGAGRAHRVRAGHRQGRPRRPARADRPGRRPATRCPTSGERAPQRGSLSMVRGRRRPDPGDLPALRRRLGAAGCAGRRGSRLEDKVRTTRPAAGVGSRHRRGQHRPQAPLGRQGRAARRRGPAGPRADPRALGRDRRPPRRHRVGPDLPRRVDLRGRARGARAPRAAAAGAGRRAARTSSGDRWA